MKVEFTSDFDWRCVDPKCQCQTITAYKAGWSGEVKDAVAKAAFAAGKAVKVPNADPISDE